MLDTFSLSHHNSTENVMQLRMNLKTFKSPLMAMSLRSDGPKWVPVPVPLVIGRGTDLLERIPGGDRKYT